ncbi:MAG: NAD-dependent succinate-semialdehyde dehydrogenase [Pseudomonadota bacterium]
MPIESVNPATGETSRTFAASSGDLVDKQLARAGEAFRAWARRPLADRIAVLRRAGEIFESEKQSLGELATREMGKPIRAARAEAAKCAAACRHYADHAAAYLAPEPVDGPDQAVWFQPLGAILAVMPWNFPFFQAVRFAAPALVAGNVGLLKPASNVPQCALALENVFRSAGAPEGVFQTLLIGSDAVERVIADDCVAAVTLTGSEGAGRRVAETAGRYLKKSVLELGGSDPFIVLASADVEVAAMTAVEARVVNNGQSCIAAKRFIVVESVYEAFESAFVQRMRALRVGDPMNEATDVGPLATRAIRDELARQVKDSVAAGARVILGGGLDGDAAEAPHLNPRGNFFPPTVLTNVAAGSPAGCEELFGPVAALFRVANADEALARANDTRFGLGASVWTADRAEAARFAGELDAGTVFVNGMVVSDPRFPFGGVKQSGYGRELGLFGLREFVNIKTVRMNWR